MHLRKPSHSHMQALSVSMYLAAAYTPELVSVAAKKTKKMKKLYLVVAESFIPTILKIKK